MRTERVFSGVIWEKQVGYCRAIKKGNFIAISGTTAIDDNGGIFAPGSAYAQTKRCFVLIEKALKQMNASLSDIVRTRMFVTNLSLANEYGRAHMEAFKDFPPTTSLIGVHSLILPELLVEVEADAILSS